MLFVVISATIAYLICEFVSIFLQGPQTNKAVMFVDVYCSFRIKQCFALFWMMDESFLTWNGHL